MLLGYVADIDEEDQYISSRHDNLSFRFKSEAYAATYLPEHP